ncbi:hypothetical protein LWC08_01480 [Desulfobaculum bizertense]|uniref:hypothetical protein n=1 Tax=Desulfobaculum bizertense TaxID=376490 RepID=UPI001F2295AF|nr:hypothetical protein [Desulfobaculum bizertense]UIJ38259.1 hypothetical protein LWC08_01480 [Desulfobaculum bizertense]
MNGIPFSGSGLLSVFPTERHKFPQRSSGGSFVQSNSGPMATAFLSAPCPLEFMQGMNSSQNHNDCGANADRIA